MKAKMKFLVELKMMLAAGLMVFGFSACSQKVHNSPASSYELKTMEPTECELSSSYSASIRGRQDIRIVPRVDGYLTEVRVNEGSKMKEGEVMFVIDQLPYKAALENAKANVEMSKAALATAQLNLDSRTELHRKNIVSDYDLSSAQNNVATSLAQLKMAEAQLELAQNNLSYTIIKSPSSGVVGKLPYRKGDYVSPAIMDGLTVVADNSVMYVYFSMTESQVMDLMDMYGNMQKAIAQMPQVALMLNNGKEYEHKGRVESVSGVIDANTGAVSVRAAFPNPDGYLLSGGSGSVIMPYKREGVFIIPQEATFEIQDKVYVYKVVDGKTRATIVKVDKINNGKQYIVTDGLNEGDIIIAQGAGLIKEGESVVLPSSNTENQDN